MSWWREVRHQSLKSFHQNQKWQSKTNNALLQGILLAKSSESTSSFLRKFLILTNGT